MTFETPVEVKAARALSPNGGGWVLRGDYSYAELTWYEDQAGAPKPTEDEWLAKIAELEAE